MVAGLGIDRSFNLRCSHQRLKSLGLTVNGDGKWLLALFIDTTILQSSIIANIRDALLELTLDMFLWYDGLYESSDKRYWMNSEKNFALTARSYRCCVDSIIISLGSYVKRKSSALFWVFPKSNDVIS